MNHLEHLNERQKEAVLKTEGPLLIIAGAGAGKTKTITHRILHLIKSGVAPSQILAITFTNKAAKETRDRIMKLIREDKELNLPISMSEAPFMSTFHSLGVHILRAECARLHLPRHFAIYDRSDSRQAVKRAIEAVGLDPKQFEPGKILGAISRQKGDYMTLDNFREETGNDYFPSIVARIWARYEEILREEKALDFDDLLLKTTTLLSNHADVLARYHTIWRYIHVDEYQDTNRVQYMITKLLAGREKNLCVVGDADQTIYSWRGADIKNILTFERDYPEATVVLLEENYRSTQTILQAANTIIQKNKARKEKNLFTKNIFGDKIGLFAGYDELEEAYFIAERAREIIQAGNAPNEIAVLYRANFQSRVLEEAFLAMNIPYQVLGVRFFERKEVKDVLSLIRAALNPAGSADVARVVNVPPRGIGKVTLLKILADRRDTLPLGMKKKVDEFFSLLERIKILAEKEIPSALIKKAVTESGLEAHLMNGTDEDKERLENIRELVTLATKYDYLQAGEGILKLLEDAALATDQDSLIKDEKAVKLMTVHASKGLEFDTVFISGLEDGLFPHKRQYEEGDIDMEEERRLFYVALTRARKKVILSFAGMRTIFGSKQANIPSEFVTDIEEELLEAEEKKSFARKTIYF